MGLNTVQKKERADYLETNLNITECSQRKPYAFISYASDNWEAVFKSAVVPLQKQHGLRVYADKAFDKVNDKWIVPMLRNVRGADLMIAFVSQSYIESYACFLELLTAVNSKKQSMFVSLGEKLRLGDTTDQPEVERGVKNEILNQGSNLSTNTNNTSNDIMRAMKSAYTSLSTLLEQDALSKYDLSDAFINFFRDASINQKTIHDLGAVLGTIESISGSVFDPSLITDPVNMTEPAAPVWEPIPQPVSPQIQTAEAVQSTPPETEAIHQSREPSRPETAQQPKVTPEAGQPEGEVKQYGTPSAQPSSGRPGLMRRIAEGWKNNSPVIALVGTICGVLGLITLCTTSITGVTFLFFCIIGIICGAKGLKSREKILSVAALILCGLEIVFLIVSGVLVAMGIV